MQAIEEFDDAQIVDRKDEWNVLVINAGIAHEAAENAAGGLQHVGDDLPASADRREVTLDLSPVTGQVNADDGLAGAAQAAGDGRPHSGLGSGDDDWMHGSLSPDSMLC
ncbi:protein of unknown function [Candidatus Promineifilum breve]|uniref:Uncharacterized protein n=1 Tax=Candidatus Promineifilum breve TaxID=1806508 RepID=A0A160T676_9CHLR|nr:protein of unknown function [Candidatus Promineifilum breve]